MSKLSRILDSISLAYLSSSLYTIISFIVLLSYGKIIEVKFDLYRSLLNSMSRLPYNLRAVSPDLTVNWSSFTKIFLEPKTWNSLISPFFIKSKFTEFSF